MPSPESLIGLCPFPSVISPKSRVKDYWIYAPAFWRGRRRIKVRESLLNQTATPPTGSAATLRFGTALPAATQMRMIRHSHAMISPNPNHLTECCGEVRGKHGKETRRTQTSFRGTKDLGCYVRYCTRKIRLGTNLGMISFPQTKGPCAPANFTTVGL